MLIIPYQTRFTTKSLPLVTIGLILLNFLVFFVFQSGDAKSTQAAAEYYFNSQLPRVELPRYSAWLEQQSDAHSREVLKLARAQAGSKTPWRLVSAMQNDGEFMRELSSGAIVTPTDPDYTVWREQRERFQELMSRVFTERYSLKTSEPSALRLITSQFLHADVTHIVGNMLVLLLVGPFAEAALGRWRFLFGYLVSGIFAGAIHLLVSDGAVVGASGAIAGAMAMVAVLYGMRRVPVFYSVLFYFDTARLPALALLPIWMFNEVFQWSTETGSHVAYWSHLGGFAAGAVVAWVLRPSDVGKVDRILDEHFADERKVQRQSSLLSEAQQAASRLDTKRAARAYSQLLQDSPDNVGYAIAYFNMALLGRNKETLADACLRVLWIRSRGARSELRNVYLQMSQPHVLGDLPVDEQLRLARRLVATREHSAALRVIDSLLDDPTLRELYGRQIADCLLGLFTTYSRHGLKTQADSVRARLSKHFPSPATLGGLAPRHEAPLTIRGSTQGRRTNTTQSAPLTLQLDMDTQLNTRWEP